MKSDKIQYDAFTYGIYHLDDAAKIGFLNLCGRIYIGDVEFATHQELTECHIQCDDEREHEEFYIDI